MNEGHTTTTSGEIACIHFAISDVFCLSHSKYNKSRGIICVCKLRVSGLSVLFSLLPRSARVIDPLQGFESTGKLHMIETLKSNQIQIIILLNHPVISFHCMVVSKLTVHHTARVARNNQLVSFGIAERLTVILRPLKGFHIPPWDMF
jgi:hypothetical protein